MYFFSTNLEHSLYVWTLWILKVWNEVNRRQFTNTQVSDRFLIFEQSQIQNWSQIRNKSIFPIMKFPCYENCRRNLLCGAWLLFIISRLIIGQNKRRKCWHKCVYFRFQTQLVEQFHLETKNATVLECFEKLLYWSVLKLVECYFWRNCF